MNEFDWQRYPKVQVFLDEKIDKALQKNKSLKAFADDLEKKSSTRLFDWLDHLVIGREAEPFLREEGYTKVGDGLFRHFRAQFPKVVTDDRKSALYVTVESIEDFFLARGQKGAIEGSPLASYRRALVSDEGGVEFWVVERRSETGIKPEELYPEEIAKRLEAKSLWALRDRADEKAAFEIADKMVRSVGAPLAASFVLEHERGYWQKKNRAGEVQKNRQDRLGMGWANHDHHTFRSSRKHFKSLVLLFERLGFRSRERFYAGDEAGWGAQVMEHPDTRLVLFLDVDLSPEEIQVDFAHQELPPRDNLGTIGLWCALHGDSILEAGMHHLEAQFVFDRLKADLKDDQIDIMNPFSNFEYLKQAFTKGEIWKCSPERLEKLFRQGLITEAQKARFLEEGALGSHLENLERRDGYKGFNQKNVSFIIKETDPRR